VVDIKFEVKSNICTYNPIEHQTLTENSALHGTELIFMGANFRASTMGGDYWTHQNVVFYPINNLATVM